MDIVDRNHATLQFVIAFQCTVKHFHHSVVNCFRCSAFYSQLKDTNGDRYLVCKLKGVGVN